MEDREIVALFFDRSERAISAAAKKYGKYLNKTALNILGNESDAEECVNDAYLNAWNSIPPQRPNALGTYLAKLVRRGAIDRYRRHTAEKRGNGVVAVALDELAECLPAATSVEKQVEQAELTGHLNSFILQLPAAERGVFVARYWHLYSTEEIAARYGFSKSKVKTTLCRTRKKLLTHLKKEGLV